MAVEYRLDLRDTFGVKQAELVGQAGGVKGGFTSLAYRKVVNAEGLLTFGIEADSTIASEIAHRWTVEVWRRDVANGIAWYRDFTAIVPKREWAYRDHDMMTVTCPGILWLLRGRHVLYYSGVANRSTFSAVVAETIMKTLVSYNAAASATVANGRFRAGTLTGLTVQADGGTGTAQTWSCAADNLLETLQKLAPIAGGDFDLLPNSNPPNYVFNWYLGQRGADRHTTVVYSLENGNMADPVYTDDRTDERTVAIVLGQGAGTQRAKVIRTSSDYVLTTNDPEMVIDARDQSATAMLNARGDAGLAEKERKRTFSFRALQTPACLYGKHVFMGDLVTAKYLDVVNVTRKIVAHNVSYADQGEIVTPEFGNT